MKSAKIFKESRVAAQHLLFEKIVATYSKQTIWIVDSSKLVSKLGKFPLPVEVIPYGSQQLMRIFTEKGYNPALRSTETGESLSH